MRDHLTAMVEAAVRLGVERPVAEELARNALQAWIGCVHEQAERRGLPDAVAFAMANAADEELGAQADAISDVQRQMRVIRGQDFVITIPRSHHS